MRSSILKVSHYLLVASLFFFAVNANAFGTLLTSPFERKQLDKQRQNKEVVPLPAQNLNPRPVLKSVSFEGIVTRHDGPAGVWLNGQLLDKPAASRALYTRHGATGVELKLQSSPHPVWLKPGQLLDVDSGEFSDTYLGGRSNSRLKQPPETRSEQLKDSTYPLSDGR